MRPWAQIKKRIITPCCLIFIPNNRLSKKTSPAEELADASGINSGKYKIFFDDTNSIRLSTKIFLLLCLIFLSGLFIAGKYIETRPDTEDTFFKLKENVTTRSILIEAYPYISTIFISILSSYLAVMFLNRDNLSRNFAVRSLAHRDVLEAIFSILSSFKMKYKYDQIVSISLQPTDEFSDILLLRANISSYSTMVNRDIKFRFNRFCSDDESKHTEGIGLFEYEFIFHLDETALIKTAGDSEHLTKYYSIHSVAVNNNEHALESTRKEPGKNYSFKLKDRPDPNEQYKLEYTMTMPTPLQSYIYFTALFPTNRFHVIFDYSLVKDRINVYCTDLLNSTGANPNLPVSLNDTLSVRHSGWVIPKSSVVFVWYTKDEDKNAGQTNNTTQDKPING